jgi:hypothetical protein
MQETVRQPHAVMPAHAGIHVFLAAIKRVGWVAAAGRNPSIEPATRNAMGFAFAQPIQRELRERSIEDRNP